MTPEEAKRFAIDYLEPRLTWLQRHDLTWSEPSNSELVSPIEFLLTPIGPVKCDFGLGVPPVSQGRDKVIHLGFGFQPLFVPFTSYFTVPLPVGREWSARWPLRPGQEDQLAADIVSAVEARWPKAVREMGSIEGLEYSLQYDAIQSAEMLEVLAYARIVIGDSDGADRSLSRTRRFALSAVDEERVAHMEVLIRRDRPAALAQLATWRLRNLDLLGLQDLAAPWLVA
jgi:hypothetical protein